MPSTWLIGSTGDTPVGAAATYYFQVGTGGQTTSTPPAESVVATKCQFAGTYSKLTFRIHTNTRTNATTFRSRKNSANGLMTFSVAAGATGEFQDAVNSDTVAVNDLYAFQAVAGSGGGTVTIRIRAWHVMFTPSANTITLLVSLIFSSNTASLGTTYWFLSGSPGGATATTLGTRLYASGFTLKRLGVTVTPNTRTAATTFQLNEATAGLLAPIVTFNAAETGEKIDLTGVKTVTDPAIDGSVYSIAIGQAAGSGNITPNSMYIYAESTVSGFFIVANDYATFFSPPGTSFGGFAIGGSIYSDSQIMTEAQYQVKSPVQFYITRISLSADSTNITGASSVNIDLRINGVVAATVIKPVPEGDSYTELTGLAIQVQVNDLLTWFVSPPGGNMHINQTVLSCTLGVPSAPSPPIAKPLQVRQAVTRSLFY